MLSVGQFAKLAKVSARTVRYYESIGLLPAVSRGENNYRYYDRKWLEQIARIRSLQELGFSLEEIQAIVRFSPDELRARLKEKLESLADDISELEIRREKIRQLLSVSKKIESGEWITTAEKELFMESIGQEVIQGLRHKYPSMNDAAMAYLERDVWLTGHPDAVAFIKAVQECLEFAKRKNLILGTARGSAPASLSLFGLGISGVDPLAHQMIPERLSAQSPFFHVDVEYERGQEFVDYCKEMNKTLACGEIQVFKMPLIDVVKSTHGKIGKVLDYDKIDDGAECVLKPFRDADVERIFQFDFSEDALVMQFEKFLPEYRGLAKMTEYLQTQTIHGYRDILNITALWRPHCQEMIDRIERYKFAKQNEGWRFQFEGPMAEWLKPNFGMIVYHEDLIKLISLTTGWDFARSNRLRRGLMGKDGKSQQSCREDWSLFQEIASPEIAKIVAEESRWSFCLPHAVSFGKFTKQSAVLKTLHRNHYYRAIDEFEASHGIAWDDIGIKLKGVSLHQS